ncbi:hypothetical protein QYF61_009097 [Mycteria americana]|uniref:Uncharacterized protein n=1 Tax=Mycteria americana TaxID=33587 RepID=A0AAN7MRQ7_MYCAM|nr:hypothetical protein QYF61_009097 [Mycteria americana]
MGKLRKGVEKFSWGLWGAAERRRAWGCGRWGLDLREERRNEGRGEAWRQVSPPVAEPAEEFVLCLTLLGYVHRASGMLVERGEVLQPSDHLHSPPLDLLQQVHVLMLGAPELDAVLQPRIRLAFWAADAHCWVMLSFSSTSTPKSFSLGLLSIHSLPSLYLCLGLP